ncbi:MAG TPA: ABC transporter substrate-binding protein [Haloplasmataceae bacterium]
MIFKKSIRVLFSALLVGLFLTTAVGCFDNLFGGKKTTEPTGTTQDTGDTPLPDQIKYVYNAYTTVTPSNWNALTYQDNNDTLIMNYIQSDFFEFDFKFDENGEIVPGQFEVEYSAATSLKDVSSTYAKIEKWGIPENTKYRAYEITLRNDLKWDDGTPIKAQDFVYTMKEQLDPLAQHYRADSYYVGATIIHNAENYVKQGQNLDNVCNGEDTDSIKYQINDLVKGSDGVYKLPNGKPIKFSLKDKLDYLGGKTVESYKNYLDQNAYNSLLALADDKGRINITDQTIDLWKTLIDTEDWGNEGPEYVPLYMVYEYTYPKVNFEDVGLFAKDDYTLVLILDKQLQLVDEEGNLTYQAAYNMNNLPLVKRDLWEANKVAPQTEDGLWRTTYHTSLESTASWGPYKLTKYQLDKEFQLEKNPNWYGYTANLYPGQYQTQVIHYDIIKEYNTALLSFLAGELDSIGIDVSVANDYKNSDRAYYTPDDFVASLQLQSNVDALRNRQKEGENKTILGYVEFRQALSLGINRSAFTQQTTTSSLPGFGLFNSMHYYDVANGKVYRNEDVARKVLCEIYNVNWEEYPSLTDAENAITGYDLAKARELVTTAYNKAKAEGEISDTDVVVLTMGTGTLNETVKRRFNFLQEAWIEMVKTTPLEGRLRFEQIEKGEKWANDFRDGAYDVCMGGWTGAAWDPGYFLLAYLSPGYMYSRAWDTNSHMLTFKMPGVGPDGTDVEDTLSLLEWYNCLNGLSDAKYNWGRGSIPEEKRLLLIAALEKEILGVYYTVPLYNNYSASLLSYKVEYITYDYNTFMGYGGIRYMTYNRTVEEWNTLIDYLGGEINYKG